MQRALFPELELPPILLAGRFVIERTIGDGGMGIVFAAHDLRLGREVAIKLLTCTPANTELAHEARCVARINHPNVVTVHDLLDTEYGPCLIMERLAGTSARAWAREHWPWPVVLDVYLRAGEGLVAAHEVGVIHGDFKPDNVAIELHGGRRRVKVLDFGLARARDGEGSRGQRGCVVGTLAYLAPERLRGAAIDEPGDQFSYCVALWEALAGRLPFAGQTAEGLLLAQASVAPRLDMLPRELQETLRRGLAFDPRARHPSMAALLRALEELLERG